VFKKVHLRLALLCAGITIFILFVMSCGYLIVSEQGLKSSGFLSFQSDMNTLIRTLDEQTIITHEWLARTEADGRYLINVVDNGVPFLYNERYSSEQKELFASAWDYYNQTFAAEPAVSASDTFHTEFAFSSAGRGADDYYACVVTSQRHSGTFQVMILCSMEPLLVQIRTQRFLFLLMDLAAFGVLALFSWYFTKRILQPLEENQRRQNQFIASASHELRTPLAVILSCASASGKASEAERQSFLDSIQSEGLRMSRLIEDMLMLTRADRYRWTIQKEPTELDTLLLDTFEAFEPVAKENDIRFLITLPEDAVPSVLCDPERIRQVLAILLHNAFSYTKKGGSVRLLLSHDGKSAKLAVSDTGIGIPDEEKKKIFERFYRADEARSEKGHFGLGLCIAAEIVNAHHGRILVEDTPGGGSTFTVVL